MPDDIIREFARFRADGVPCVLAVVVKVEGSAPRHPGAKMLIFGGGESLGTIGGGALEAAVMKEAPAVLAQGEPAMLKYDLRPDLGMVCGGRAEVYLEPHLTPPRLFIFGAGHIGLALCPVAAELGFMVTVVDDREGLATPERFPRAAALILSFDPEQWEGLIFDERDTYCVVATMGHVIDTEVVANLVERPFAYLGMLGSPTKLNALVRELEKRGAPAGPLSAVRTPMGLSIGAETPAEIAVSIAAEITQIRRTNGPESSEI